METGRNGYSLVGVLIYVAIAAASLFTLASIFRSGLETSQGVQAERTLREASAFALERVQERLEAAGAVTTPAAGTSATLSMDAPVAGESPVTFSLSAGRLLMQLGTAQAQPITPPDVAVTAFAAERLAGSPAAIRVTLTLAQGTLPVPTTLTSSITVTLRYD